MTTTLVKFVADGGRVQWRRSLKVPGPEHSDEVAGFAVLNNDDLIVAGGIEIDGHVRFVALRLSGRTGRPQWRQTTTGDPRTFTYDHAAHAVAVDSAGDALVAGDLESATYLQYHQTHDLAVVKLAGDTGMERWRFVLDGTAHQYDSAGAVAVDARGGVLVGGSVTDLAATDIGHRTAATILKLAGSDGHLIWRREVSELSDLRGMRLAADGAVLAAGTFVPPGGGNDFGVVKVDGQTGTTGWAASMSKSDYTWEAAFDVTALPSGDVAAIGFTEDLDAAASFTVAAFDGTTGAERWHRFIDGSDGKGEGATIGATARGNVVAGGRLRNVGSCYDVAVLELDGRTGRTVSERTLDGTTTATKCEPPQEVEPCRGRCPLPPPGHRSGHAHCACDRSLRTSRLHRLVE